MAKTNLAQIVKIEREYHEKITQAITDLDSLNVKADALQEHNYEIAQRSHLAVYIDEMKLAYRERIGYEYVPSVPPKK